MKLKNEITLEIIQDWLLKYIASLIKKNPTDMNIMTPFSEYGLDSMHAIGLSGDIEGWLGFPIEPTIAWDYPTIEVLSHFLLNEMHFLSLEINKNNKVA